MPDTEKVLHRFIEALKLASIIFDEKMTPVWASNAFNEHCGNDKESIAAEIASEIQRMYSSASNNEEIAEIQILVNGKATIVKAVKTNTGRSIASIIDGNADKADVTSKVHDVIMSNVRMGIIYEKLNVLADYSSTVINYFDINTIFTTLIEFLTRRDKFGCQGVFIYFVDKKGKVKTWGSIKLMKEFTKDATKLEDPSVLTSLLNKYSGVGSKIILPIKTGNSINGLVGIVLSKQELKIAQGSLAINEIYNKLYKSIIQLTNISIENAMARETLFLQSILDPLTGTYNRRYLESKLSDEVNRAKRYNRDLSIILVDLNGFKKINDNYGHNEGDYLLKELAKLILQSVRTIDTLARYGGDEFLIILPETSRDGAEKKVAILKEMVRKKTFILTNRKRAKITISAGIATVSEFKDASQDKLLKEVDKSMYKDKLTSK